MSARAYGCLASVQVAAQTLTQLMAAQIQGFTAHTFSAATVRAHYDNADRLFLVINGRDSGYLVPGEPLEFRPPHSPISTDEVSFRSAIANDRLFVAGVES